MALNREKPSLFELMRGGRPDAAPGRADSQAAESKPAADESGDEAEWLQDFEGHPIGVVDDEETRRIIDELGLTLIAEQTNSGPEAEAEVESQKEAVEPDEVFEAGIAPAEAAESVAAEPPAETPAEPTGDPRASTLPLRSTTRDGGTRRIVADPRRGFAATDASKQSVFAGRFLPDRGPVPRVRCAAERESVEQQSIFGPREEAETSRRLIRSDTLAAALGSALLFLALAFLVGRVSARDGAEQAGPGEAPASPLARRAVSATPEAPAASVAPAVGAAAPVAAAPVVAAPAPAVAAPTAARPYHVRVVTTTRATAADLVKFLNKQEPVLSRGLKAYGRRVRSNTVVYIGSFESSDDPAAQSVCDFVKTVSFNGRQDFGGAVIRRKI